jgi:arylsulfatase A-like enzyme
VGARLPRRTHLEGSEGAGLKPLAAFLGSVIVVIAAAALAPVTAELPDNRPNILLVLTDDQTLDTLPSDPPAMPWLQSQLEDPDAHWLWFPNASASTPLCCPARASILTGQFDTRTHVRSNDEGPLLDDSETIATWLDDAGYHTGLVGKYLNFYPWGRVPFIPPGWDRWFAKQNASESTAYYDYEVMDQGVTRHIGAVPQTYVTDVLADRAVRFVQTAPTDQPWFLYFSPNAPHLPWVPAPRHLGAFADLDPPIPPLAVMNDVAGKPSYVSLLPAKSEQDRAAFMEADRREREMLLAVDEAFRALFDAVAARGELERTVIVFLTDNGYTFGLHRLDGKRFPYAPSTSIPFAIRSPWTAAATVGDLVMNVDLAATFASLAGVEAGRQQDGIDLTPALFGRALPARPGLFLDWGGDESVPAWRAVRTQTYLYVRNADGFEELYLPDDVYELHNRASDPSMAHLLAEARMLLDDLASSAGG